MGKKWPKMAKKCQKEPKFGFPRRHVAEPGKVTRKTILTKQYAKIQNCSKENLDIVNPMYVPVPLQKWK